MAIPKNKACLTLTPEQVREVAEIEQLLDNAIQQNPNDVRAWKKEWATKEPGPQVILRLTEIYREVGWKLETQPDRDGLIIWLK
ncbi:MAG: hypothetical protein PHG25_03445 [Candidatus Pacebacteria bacterium]|nr:hypothetical protein [Candidatus Paceibacterota bacterium]